MPKKTSEPAPIVVVGAGYVGLVNVAGFAAYGHEIWCVDVDEKKVDQLAEGDTPIGEPELDQVLGEHRDQLHFTTSLPDALKSSGAPVAFVAVGTPSRFDGAPNLDHVKQVMNEIPATSDVVIAMKSTVTPGTGHGLLARAQREGKRLSYVSCPEFLREGSAMQDFRNPDRVVVGATESLALEAVCALHEPIVGSKKILKTDIASAEMIKHGSNGLLATRISFINEIANICEETGADVEDVARGMGMDSRIGPKFLKAGVGFGGSCFFKDVRALSWTARAHGCRFGLGDALLAANHEQADRVIRKLQRHLGHLGGRTIALLGIAFKPETDDLRNGTAFAIADRLRHHGATIRAYDPSTRACQQALVNAGSAVTQNEWLAQEELAMSVIEALHHADACVLVTEWEEFETIDWNDARDAMDGDLVLDGRNKLDLDSIVKAGLTYEGTGRNSVGLWTATPAADPTP